MKDDTILIESRFHGPPESGNGGYVCGRLAQFIDGPAAIVRLHVPPPLDTELQVRRSEAGIELFNNDVLVAYELAHQGRKHHTATALFGEAGACLGLGLGTWFEVDQDRARNSAQVS